MLFGLAGADELFGGNGKGFLFGGGDIMDAGGGNDRIHVNVSDIFASGGDGVFDVLVLMDNAPIPDTPNQGVTVIDLGDALDQNQSEGGPRLQGFEAVDASIAATAVDLRGAALNGFGNMLFGSGFADTVTGSTNVDILLGGGGADMLAGGNGDDTIIADSGNDTLTGGGGSDIFFYPGGPFAGAVVITDFEPGVDSVPLADTLPTPQQAKAMLIDVGGNAVLDFGNGASITFAGVSPAAISVDDFDVV